MSLERFQYLLAQFKEDRLSPEEGVVFREMLRTGQYDAVVEEDFLQLLKAQAPHEGWTQEREAELLKRVQEKLEPVANRKPILLVRKRWIHYAAAAVVTGTIVVTVYYHRHPSVPTVSVIAPGGNKALLTLGDGTRITMDSAANGMLANRGGVQVINLPGGILTYKGVPAGSEVLYNKLETPKGGEYQVILPDGTHAWLNAASSIRYPQVFIGRERKVEITGEVYLEVARNEKMPFVATARGTEVKVLGTGFDLMAYADEGAVRTTLVEGAVKVSVGSADRLLRPGEEAVLDSDEHRIRTTRADLSQVLAWKEGRFRFDGVKITAIMRQIARWYDVDVEYQGAAPDNEFNGSIDRQADAARILEVLEMTGNVHFNIQGNKIIVIPGPR